MCRKPRVFAGISDFAKLTVCASLKFERGEALPRQIVQRGLSAFGKSLAIFCDCGRVPAASGSNVLKGLTPDLIGLGVSGVWHSPYRLK